MRRHRNSIILGLTLLVGVAGVAKSVGDVKQYNHRPYLHDNLYLPSGKFLQYAAMGYDQLAADMVWFSAVQYYGEYRQDLHGLAYFEGLVNLVTDLDPHFIFAYKFGALVMSQDMNSFDSAMQLLRKGMAANPTAWELPFEAGFLAYVDAGNNDMAARYFEMAGRMPGGGDRARRFAAFVYRAADENMNAVRMWEQLLDDTDDPWMRELAEFYIDKYLSESENYTDRDHVDI